METIKPNDREQVDNFIAKLEPAHAEIVNLLRKLILDTSSEISEQIKWNSPAMYYNGHMKAFNAKTYQRDIVVFNLHRGRTLLVFPTGAKIPDPNALLEGSYADGRRLITIKSLADAKEKGMDLQKLIRQWLNLVEK